jgi:hypothetical protein
LLPWLAIPIALGVQVHFPNLMGSEDANPLVNQRTLLRAAITVPLDGGVDDLRCNQGKVLLHILIALGVQVHITHWMGSEDANLLFNPPTL